MSDILGLDSLFAELIFALGLALLIGNGLALLQHRRGRRPEGAEGNLRVGRVVFLLGIGLLLAVWGGISTVQKLTGS
jgi:hypothetical protein